MAARQCRLKASPVDTGAQHNTGTAEWDFLRLLGDWIKPSSFATYHILLHGFQQFLIFHPWSWQWAFYILPISSTVQLTLSSSMSWWCFPPFWNFSLFFLLMLKIKSINQKEWEKDTGTEGHLNPFRVPRASRSEINRKLKWSSKTVAIPSFFFREVKPGAFLNPSSCFIFHSVRNGSSFPLRWRGIIAHEYDKER